MQGWRYKFIKNLPKQSKASREQVLKDLMARARVKESSGSSRVTR